MLKSTIDVEKIPVLVKSKIISEKKGLQLVALEISQEPAQYLLNPKNFELISDITYSILSSDTSFFQKYDESKLPFKNYLKMYIKYRYLTIKRNTCKKINREETQNLNDIIEYENRADSYNKTEYSYRLEDNPSSLKIANTTNLYSTNCCKNKLTISQIFKSRKYTIEKIAIIAALKSSYYIDDRLIAHISNYCKINEDELFNFVNYLKESIKQKTYRITKLQEERDSSYRMKCSLALRLEKTELNPDKAKKIYEKMKIHDLHWKKKNKIISLKKSNICPANDKISEVLGISESLVGYYLKNTSKLNKIIPSLLEN